MSYDSDWFHVWYIHTCSVYILFQLAEELLKKETLNFEEVKAILGPPPFPRKKFIDPIEFENSLKNLEKEATPEENIPTGAPSAKPETGSS